MHFSTCVYCTTVYCNCPSALLYVRLGRERKRVKSLLANYSHIYYYGGNSCVSFCFCFGQVQFEQRCSSRTCPHKLIGDKQSSGSREMQIPPIPTTTSSILERVVLLLSNKDGQRNPKRTLFSSSNLLLI